MLGVNITGYFKNNNLEKQSELLLSDYLTEYNGLSYTLSDISTIKYGKGLPTKKLTTAGYPVFGGNGIIGSYTEYLYEAPQILVSCRGAASGNIHFSYPFSFITNNSLVLELKDYRYFFFLKQYLFSNPLYSYATGSAQPQITIDNIKKVEVPYPIFEDIEELSGALKSIFDYQYQLTLENQKLEDIRDYMLPKLMSGELDISDIEF